MRAQLPVKRLSKDAAMKQRALIAILGLLTSIGGHSLCSLMAQEGGAALQLRPTPFKARTAPEIVRDSSDDQPAYELKYKLAAGLTYPSEVIQRLSVQTTINGVKEDTVTNSVSIKSWRIESVEPSGDIRLYHQVDSVKMSQRTTGKAEVSYDSADGGEIPAEYQSLEGTIGVPLTKVVMNPYGRIAEREDLKPQSNPGIGDLTLALPEEPIREGDSWLVPDEVTVKVSGAPTLIKFRYVYTLLTVRGGLATIAFRTEFITPAASDPRVMSQLVGRMQKGEIKFDIDEGRPLSRTAEIEQAIVGFAGDNSSMRYDMRATEEFHDGVAIVASLPEYGPTSGPLPAGATPTKRLSGGAVGAGEAGPTPTPAAPPPGMGEPTPAPPREGAGRSVDAAPTETSVLLTLKSVLVR